MAQFWLVLVGLIIVNIPTMIAFKKQLPCRWLIWLFTCIFAPLGWLVFYMDLSDVNRKGKKLNYVCEACNHLFTEPKKTNKILSVFMLIIIYGLLIFLVESIQSNDLSVAGFRFILDISLFVAAIIHIIVVCLKENKRGKCPYCLSEDFVLLDSVKGQNLLKQIKKNQKSFFNLSILVFLLAL